MRVTGPDLSIRWLERRGRLPYAIPILSGAFLAMRREVFEETGGFDEGLVRWGANDLELSLRLWLLGYEQRLVPQVVVGHLFRPKHPYAVAWQTILHNLLRVAFIHFNPARIERVVIALKNHPAFARALAMFPESDALSRRARFGSLRVHNDDWFFDSFGIVC
jgi:GT2 family glycosyltransferase